MDIKNRIKELQIEYAELCDMGEYAYANQTANELHTLELMLASILATEN